MATILLQYCNHSLAAEVAVQYDDVAHVIVSGMTVGPCEDPSGQLPDTLLYSHVDGNTVYEVYTQNADPYAYVTSYSIAPCSVTIDSTTVGNASDESTADGSIVVNASGPYTKQYSKNDGASYQTSNTFTGLTRGTYPIRVRSQHPDGSYCYDTENVVVGFNAVTNCELALGNITKSNPTTIGGIDGSITVNTIVDPLALAVEYRLDAGLWQDSPVFNGLGDGTYNVQVRYKAYTTCSDNRNVTLIDQGIDCDILIGTVVRTHEQSKFADDGKIEIVATSSNGPVQYSINDGAAYQASNIFQALAPGTYLVRVKDAANCEDARTVVIHPYKAPYFEFPIANGLRFVVTAGPGVDNSLQNFDNTLFRNMRAPGVEPGCYDLLRQQNDIDPIQWRSSYTNHSLKLMNADDNTEVAAISAEKVKDFTRQTDSISATLADAGSGKTQVFFENGLPEWAKVGQDITLQGTGHVTLDGLTFEIEDIAPGILGAKGYVAAIITVAFPGVGLIAGTVEVEYDIEPFDVHEAKITWGDYANGRYYLKLTATDDQFDDSIGECEPVDLATTHRDTVLIQYRNIDNAFKVFYDTGLQFMMRAEGALRRPQSGGTEVNHEESNGRFLKLYENVTRNPELLIAAVPPYLAEKLALACGHDTVLVNGVQHVKQGGRVEITYFDDESDPLCNARVDLRQAEFVAENTDDAGDVDTPQTVLGVNGVLYALNP